MGVCNTIYEGHSSRQSNFVIFMFLKNLFINTSIVVSSALHSERLHYRPLNSIVFQTSYILVPSGHKNEVVRPHFPKSEEVRTPPSPPPLKLRLCAGTESGGSVNHGAGGHRHPGAKGTSPKKGGQTEKKLTE